MPAASDPREIAVLVPMAELLRTLGFATNERTHRCVCILHGGSNPSAFAWRDDGRWHCFSCGASGDRFTLVRTLRQCSFREAVAFLAQLAGVEHHQVKLSSAEVERVRNTRKRAERAAWRIRDEILQLRIYYCDALHRSERLWQRIGGGFVRVSGEAELNTAWERLARLAPVAAFFLAAYNFLNRADAAALARFALASTIERRKIILGEQHADPKLRAA
jgi:hypothetical protein